MKGQTLVRPSGLYSVLAAFSISCVCWGRIGSVALHHWACIYSHLADCHRNPAFLFSPVRLDLCCPRCLSAGGCPGICIRNVSCTKKVNILHFLNQCFRQTHLNGSEEASIGVLDQKLKSSGFYIIVMNVLLCHCFTCKFCLWTSFL